MKTQFFKYCLIMILVMPLLAKAQKNSGQEKPKANIVARARYTGDSIVLRWAVNTELAWHLTHQSGYIVERVELGVPKAPYVRLTSAPIKPLAVEELTKRYLAGKNHYTGIALATLYGNTALNENNFTMSAASEMARMFRMRFAYNLLAADLNANAANISALRWVDKGIKPGKTYGYRIYSPINNNECILDTAIVFVDTRYMDTLPVIPKLKGNQGDRKIELIWQFLRPDFSAWDIERSDNNGKTWKKLNQNPYLVVEGQKGNDFIIDGRFIDTGLINYKTYRYRLSAITPFAEMIRTTYYLEIYPKDLTPPDNPVITKITQGKSKEMLMEWTFNGNKKELKGFRIGKGESISGPFYEISEVLPNSTRKYQDPLPDEAFGNYYVVYAIDTAGNVSMSNVQSGFITDDMPPPTPKLISAKMDTNGLVTIIWNKLKTPDLQGYRLYTANDSTHEFSLVNGDLIRDSVFYDTLTVWTLSKNKYYRLAAVDMSFNISPLTKVIRVKIPDLIPPTPPFISSAVTGGRGLEITVTGSSSNDVASQYIQYLETGSKGPNVVKLKINPNEVLTFIDSVSVAGKAYELRAFAIDSSGNRSDYSPVVYAQMPKSNKGIILLFKADYKTDKKKVDLVWTLQKSVEYVVIYRSAPDGQLESYKQVKGKTLNFEDDDLKPGTKYEYAIKAIGPDFSIFSQLITVSIPK